MRLRRGEHARGTRNRMKRPPTTAVLRNAPKFVWCGVTACGQGRLHRMREHGAPHTATRPLDLSLHILKRQCGRVRRPPTLGSSARWSHTSACSDGGRGRSGRVGSWSCVEVHTLAGMGVRPVVVRPDRRRVGGRRGRSPTWAYAPWWRCRMVEPSIRQKVYPPGDVCAGLCLQRRSLLRIDESGRCARILFLVRQDQGRHDPLGE